MKNRSAFKSLALGLMSFLLTAVQSFSAQGAYAPALLKKLVATPITHHGPNCWNSALVGSGMLGHLRFTSPTEFRFLVDSAACRAIPAGHQQPGDIQVYVRTMQGLPEDMMEVHANIWLTPETVFNKMTNFASARYELTTQNKVNENYAHTPEILRFSLENPVRQLQCQGDDCQNRIEYRRCGSIKNLKRADPHYSVLIERLVQRLELNIEKQILSEYRETADAAASNRELLTRIEAEVENTCGLQQSFYCRYAREAIGSLTWQLTQVQPNWLK